MLKQPKVIAAVTLNEKPLPTISALSLTKWADKVGLTSPNGGLSFRVKTSRSNILSWSLLTFIAITARFTQGMDCSCDQSRWV